MLLLLWLLSLSGTDAQFAEIASLATSFLGPALSGGGLGGLAGLAGTAGQAGAAAGGAAGALGQIGQLYQLAQGALQLTSTGVGVLNQASEGNWFPAALETAAKNQEQLRKNGGGMGGLPGLGGLGGHGGGLPGLMPLGPLGPLGGKSSGGASVGPEFGTNFPAPNIEDYNEEIDITTTTTKKPKSPFESVEIEDKDLQSPSPTAPTTTTQEPSTEPVTLFPEEEETFPPSTERPKKQIRIELPKEEEDYIDQITKEGATRVEVTNREKKDEDENLFLAAPTIPRALPVVTAHSATVPKGEKKIVMVPGLDKLVTALREKSHLSEEEIMEIVGQVETNSQVDKPPKVDFGSGVQNINEKKADNRKRILEASRRIDDHLRGQSHRKLSKVTLAPTAAPTPAPFVHSTSPPTHPPPPPPQPAQEILNNRLQREIIAAGAAAAGDKDLLSSRPVLQKPTPPPVARFVYPPPQQQNLHQPQPQAQVYQQPQLLTSQPQRVQGVYQNQIPNSFPIQQQQPQTQQQQIQQYYQQYQQYYQQYYPQYYQQQLQRQQQQQQQYGQFYQQQPVTQQPQAQQMYHTQQQVVLTGTTQPRVQPPQQVQHVQQQQPLQQQRVYGDVRQQKPVQVSGQSSRIYTNQPSGAAFFVATKDTPIVRRQRQPHARVQAVKTVRRSTPPPPGVPFQRQQLQQQRRFFARTAQPIPLTTPSPVRGDARVAGRSNPANL